MRYFLVLIIGLWVSAAAADINRFTVKLGSGRAPEIDSVQVFVWFGIDVQGGQGSQLQRTTTSTPGPADFLIFTFLSRDEPIVVPPGTKLVAVQAIGYLNAVPVTATPFELNPVLDYLTNGQGVVTVYFRESLSEALRETVIFRPDSTFATRFEDHSVLISNAILHFLRVGLIYEKADYTLINEFLENTDADILRLSESERDQLFGMMISIFNERIRKTDNPDIFAFLEFFVRFGNDMLGLGAERANVGVMLRPDLALIQSMERAYALNTLGLLEQATISLQALRTSRNYKPCIEMAYRVMDSMEASVFANSGQALPTGLTSDQMDQVISVLRTGQSCVRLDVASFASQEIGDLVISQQWGKLATYYSDDAAYGRFNRLFLSIFDHIRADIKPDARFQISEVLNYAKILAAGGPTVTQ